jgi:hypothetical protein
MPPGAIRPCPRATPPATASATRHWRSICTICSPSTAAPNWRPKSCSATRCNCCTKRRCCLARPFAGPSTRQSSMARFCPLSTKPARRRPCRAGRTSSHHTRRAQQRRDVPPVVGTPGALPADDCLSGVGGAYRIAQDCAQPLARPESRRKRSGLEARARRTGLQRPDPAAADAGSRHSGRSPAGCRAGRSEVTLEGHHLDGVDRQVTSASPPSRSAAACRSPRRGRQVSFTVPNDLPVGLYRVELSVQRLDDSHPAAPTSCRWHWPRNPCCRRSAPPQWQCRNPGPRHGAARAPRPDGRPDPR